MLRHVWEVFWHLQGGGETGFTAFCSMFLARLGVRLKLEVFLSSNVLINDSEAKGKVQVRLKLEGGFI